ncbi:ATP-binding cassette domain-containing protein [Oculatella sp. LEGE 06141]|uniref:ABC transporter ATP-binding protein n=1 Tax=Oculatella sp. LEGE 06141 TaxID=1828648 RepID=UPI00187F7DDB|nr:ATP-binding cassette domain-containing protein [Oculatella sp. LEGE 06141]MBE9180823.1 ATP-binding cassette domain-containing protein [Oculatella sp. LEGE 06141]
MSSYQLLLRFAGRYPGWVFLTVLLGFSGGLFNGIGTALIAPVLLGFLGQASGTDDAPSVIQTILSPFDAVPPNYRLLVMTGAVVLLILLKNLAAYFNTLVSGALKRALSNDLRETGLQLLLDVDLDFYTKIGVGDIIHRLNSEMVRAATAIMTIVKAITTIITITIFIGLLISLSWQLTIASTVLLAVVTVVNQVSIARARQFGKYLSEVSRGYSIALLDVLAGMRLVRSTANEDIEYERLKKLMRDREQAEYNSQANSAAIAPLSEVTGVVALLLIVLLGRTLLADQIEAFSTVLLAYLFLLFRTLPLMAQLNGARNQYASLSPSVDVANDFLRRDNKSFMANGSVPFQQLRQGIRFNRVSFAYPDYCSPVLKDIDLHVPRGTTLALVGASGAGKSTLADLLPRFYDPTEGSITIDDVDLRDLDIKDLRRAMGVVSQDTFLFNASVRDNIAYARPDATDHEIIEAAKKANAYEFILRLPNGLHTQIGDRGVLLSGGQRQRLAIARALLQNPEILILDEATSALDTVSERLVQEALDKLSANRTTVVIAHRLSTVQKAEQIAVLDQGKVVELGSHDELLNRGGYYAELCKMQFSETTQSIVGSTRNQIAATSYEIRTRLNAMMGSLRLIVDGYIDNPEERNELTEEAYYSALSLLKSLESLEHIQERIETPEATPLPIKPA